MFDPSREQVRDTFFGAWRKYRAGEPLVGIETIALDVILAHPEYHGVLGDPERHADADYVDRPNPFLHMSLHVALEEQLTIDQPPGIAAAFERLLARTGDRHDALYGASILIAKPIGDARHVGFIMNKPTNMTLGKLFPKHGPSQKVIDPVYLGGPMGPEVIFAMVKDAKSPGGRSMQLANG